jgi:hypothetical protein
LLVVEVEVILQVVLVEGREVLEPIFLDIH